MVSALKSVLKTEIVWGFIREKKEGEKRLLMRKLCGKWLDQKQFSRKGSPARMVFLVTSQGCHDLAVGMEVEDAGGTTFLGGIKELWISLPLPRPALNIRLFLDESFSVAAFHNKKNL